MKKFTRLSILLALAVVLNIVESLIPLFNGIIPGFKLGLANIITLFIRYKFSLKDAWNTLGEIIGETYTEELIDNLFERFCLGK